MYPMARRMAREMPGRDAQQPMLTETARVVAIEGHSVWVETLRQSSCGSCAARAGCGHGMLNSASPGSSRGLIKAFCPGDAGLELALHDRVEIAIPEGQFLRGVFVLYCLPLLTTVGAALLTESWLPIDGVTQGWRDLRVTTGAALGLAGGLVLLRYLTRGRAFAAAQMPRVTAKI